MLRLLFPLFAIAFAISAVQAAEPLPDFGVMLNDDGDLSFTSLDPQESARNVLAQVDSLAGTSVKTLMWSVGAGSEILYYPTKVANDWRWRPIAPAYEMEFGSWQRKAAAGLDAGVDPIRIAGERAKALGMFFVPSYRMNDDHFIFDPVDYPLTGKFWIDNHDKMKIGESPQPADAHYGNLLDFTHPEVRHYRLDVIFEVIERYEDNLDGIELDFNRFQMIFPKDKGFERGHLVTEMIGQVRKRLDEAAERQGRPLYLFVRVPPSLADCHRMGYRIEDWMNPRIVDVILPSQLMTLAHDMPVRELVDICKPAGVAVMPSLYPRTSYMWPFLKNPKAEDYPRLPSRDVTPELWRGAVANYWQQGASGFQLFNFNLPADEWTHTILRDTASPLPTNLASRANKIFAITPGYYLDHTDTYEYKKQIPAIIKVGEPSTFTIQIGEDYSDPARKAAVDHCAIRLGFKKGIPLTGWSMELQANGMVLHKGPVDQKLIETQGALVYFQSEISDLAALYHGKNTLRIVLEGVPEASLEEVLVGVFFREHDLNL
ncbi:MAG: hypothetical protein JNK74_12675 [Candidatus Hydrogenedentes bacterium]|nr:hypothetical protein [Candidatus Hydrogenedentota bacterium]